MPDSPDPVPIRLFLQFQYPLPKLDLRIQRHLKGHLEPVPIPGLPRHSNRLPIIETLPKTGHNPMLQLRITNPNLRPNPASLHNMPRQLHPQHH